ncbi:LOW QUALITY PROTEIN: disease resistance protein RPM1-like [Typha latifolia]|uniref:LOW QUALITY PROTEIN: disease resistance protein RPM1-like n=1 Tax=Typha latifolia TaxID=4733 RepID=UPI003C307F71
MVQVRQENLAKQAQVLEDIRNRMSSIRSELLVIQGFLAQQQHVKKGENPPLETWIAEVRTLAYRTQDLVDEYIHIVSHQQGYRFGDITRSLIYGDPTSIALSSIDTQLNKIVTELTNLSKVKERWIQMPSLLRKMITHTSERLSHRSHFLDEEVLVGIEENREILVRLLQSEEGALSTVSIWGMGGVGKTTLVTNVYKREAPNFGCHAWVSISQSYKIDDVLRILIKELYGEEDRVPDDIQNMDNRKLKDTLRRFLEHKRYLIILDNVWNPKAFHDLSDCLIDNHQGSRIIITTRIEDVASLAHDRCKIQLKPLGNEEGWDLFCKRTFWKEKDHICPSGIEKCAKKIVIKCQGLPLAIVSIGSLLSLRQQTESEWSLIYRQFNWELEDNPSLEDLRNVLYSSYKDLPTYVKNCFLYCSMFPEDYLLPKKRLTRLWIGEGFVQERGCNTLEEVAEDCLNELIKRSLLQVVKMNNKRRFRMHHLMRELALSLSRKESFHVFFDNTANIKVDDDARRLAVCKCSSDELSSKNMPLLRTLLAFDSSRHSSSFLSPNLSKSKYLTVLDLDGAGIWTVPDVIMDLFNLRYLCLRNSSLHSLPESIEKLSNLETLDLYGSLIGDLPRGIVKLKKLRYLNVMGGYPITPEAPKDLWSMKELQTLKGVKASRDLVKGLKYLSQLRSLAICELKDFHFMQLSASLSQMRLLSRLALSVNYENEVIQFNGLNIPSSHLYSLDLINGRLTRGTSLLNSSLFRNHLYSLRKLALKGCSLEEDSISVLSRLSNLTHLHNLRELQLQKCRLNEDSISSLSWLSSLTHLHLIKAYDGEQLFFRDGWFPSLQSLTITAKKCRLSEDSISSLSRLSNLTHLHLTKGYDGEQLFFRDGWFPNLQSLTISWMRNLNRVEMEKGTMVRLQTLVLNRLDELKEVPQGIEFLKSLQQLNFIHPHTKLKARLQESDAQSKLQHIANIDIEYC